MNITKLLRKALNALPYGSWTDRLYHFVIFLYAHKRIPYKKSGLANDYFYFLKSSGNLLDVYRQMTSDKFLVKDYIKTKIGEELTVPTIAEFSSTDEINVAALPKPCVIKPSHSSGSVVFIYENDKKLTSQQELTLKNALHDSPYKSARESNYRYLRPRLICEPMLPEAENIKDYKFFCFLGEPRLIQVDSERHKYHKRNVYTAKWKPLNIKYNFPFGAWDKEPYCLADMVRVARTLSEPFEFVRVDFFISGDKFYVGELTHCPESAHGKFDSLESERIFSSILFGSDI